MGCLNVPGGGRSGALYTKEVHRWQRSQGFGVPRGWQGSQEVGLWGSGGICGWQRSQKAGLWGLGDTSELLSLQTIVEGFY